MSPDMLKKVILIATSDGQKGEWAQGIINRHLSNPVVYLAEDGPVALSKLQNVPPHVLVTDYELPKLQGSRLIGAVLGDNRFSSTSIIVMAPPPEQEAYLDELVTGRVAFLTDPGSESEFLRQLAKALTYSAHREQAEFHFRFLARGDQLIREGDEATFVYIVRRGRLRAYRIIEGKDVTLGEINLGEFVGEMAFIDGQPRSANVEALEDCELIEVPFGALERILYTRPSWSKALMHSLSRRLKESSSRRGGQDPTT
jgi:CRP/FNR family transcriptional regulator, cyclic AMP receptor protein